MKVEVSTDKELISFLRLRKEIREHFNFTFKQMNKIYDYIIFNLKVDAKTEKLVFHNEIMEVIKNIQIFENLVKSKYYYDKNNKDIVKLYKSVNAVYPKKKIKSHYKPYTLSMNKNYNPNNLENRIKYKTRINVLTKINECHKIITVDTETFKGYCRLICRSESDLRNDKSDIYRPTFDSCIDFLCYHIDKPNVHRFMFNIDFDVSAILKLYPYKDKTDFIDKLSKGITMKYENGKHSYEFTWIRSKMFKIKNIERDKCIIFTDLYTFYNLGLGKAGKKYLNSEKDKIDGKRLNTDINYWLNHKKDIIKYCIKDCNLTKELGWLLINTIKDNGLKLPKLLVSPASISKQEYRFDNFIPSMKHVPLKIAQIGYNTYYGGRFEVFKRGKTEKGYLYDIVSQYSCFIKELPDMFNGLWIEYKNMEKLPLEQTFGYFLCQVKILMNEKIPTLPIKHKGLVCFPNGTFWSWFTWYDLDLMRDYIISIKKAYIYEPNERNFKPFYDKTIELVDKKRKINKKDNWMSYNIVKITMNGLYGCFVEKHEKIYLDKEGKEYKRYRSGILFNPIYASQITAFGRWSVIKDVPKEKKDNIIAIHTDSIITDIDMSEYLDIGKKLGQWNLECKGKTSIIGTGIYQVGKIVKTRGIPFKYIKNWFKFYRKNKSKKEVKFIITHMKKVREAIIRDKSVINVNRMFDIERSVKCNSDVKRTWISEFENFNDLSKRQISSLPYFSFENEFGLNPNPIILSEQVNIPINQITYILKNYGY